MSFYLKITKLIWMVSATKSQSGCNDRSSQWMNGDCHQGCC